MSLIQLFFSLLDVHVVNVIGSGAKPVGIMPSKVIDKPEKMLRLLESLERDNRQSHRQLASELGIALGLVNAYLRRCIRKGLVKVRSAPARRYTYYLTPKGFAEKSRLTIEYLSYSFSFFRLARADCTAAFAKAQSSGFKRFVLVGVSDLAEIAMICAAESGVDIAAVVDPHADVAKFLGLPVVTSYDAVPGGFDFILITDLKRPRPSFDEAVERVGCSCVGAPALLSLQVRPRPAFQPQSD